jgi:GNAT superfamily N-acetyltransferase
MAASCAQPQGLWTAAQLYDAACYYNPERMVAVLSTPDTRLWMLENDALTVGFAGVTADYLQFLFVHPQHQSKGYGARLLEQAIADVCEKGHTSMWRQAHPSAEAFYARQGFSAGEVSFTEFGTPVRRYWKDF